tara:strand:- start:5860 stop:6396 length:537 start_codon:yes stop_codon:yes gene_type:complete
MEQIFKNWNRFILSEGIEDLKNNKIKTSDFIKKASKTTDKKELEAAGKTLLQDPDIKQVVQLLQNIEEESEKMQQEGLMDDISDLGLKAGTATYQTGIDLANNPAFKTLLKFGGPVIALGLLAKAMTTGATIDPEYAISAAKVAKATAQKGIESGVETALGTVELVGKRDMRRQKWNY